MIHQQNKLENPERLKELNPEETLFKIGLGECDIVSDIGAGSGIFTIPAAKITGNTVFALDINGELLDVIHEKAKKENLSNIKPIKVTGGPYEIITQSVDLALLVTVLHEIEDKEALLNEIKRIMKTTGKLAIIEFHKLETPLGPPVADRIGRNEVLAVCNKAGFGLSDEFVLGENFYCIVFKAC